MNKIAPLNQTWRIIALFLYVFISFGIFFLSTGEINPAGTDKGIWLVAAVAYWLMALVAAPYFVPPRDSLSTSIAVLLLLLPLDLTGIGTFKEELMIVTKIAIVLVAFVGILSLIAIFKKETNTGLVTYRLSGEIGKGEILFTLPVLISILAYYQDTLQWLVFLVAFWVATVIIKPIELLLKVALYIKGLGSDEQDNEIIGTLMRVDDPDIVRISLRGNAKTWKTNNVHAITLPDGKSRYVIPLFYQTQNDEMIGTGLCCGNADAAEISNIGQTYQIQQEGLYRELVNELSGETTDHMDVVGIVSEGSSISSINFHSVESATLEEGMVVFATIRGKRVYYQILDANTQEESFQQNPLGLQVVSAAQLGCYHPENGFEKFPWLPAMNQPLFLASHESNKEQILSRGEFVVGNVPHTNYGVPVVLSDLIEYHTAVLGITGTGKTELSLDLIRNALAEGVKVFCVDFTGEYKVRLADNNPKHIGLSIEQGTNLEKHLYAVETGEFGAKKEKAALIAFLDEVRPQVTEQIENFLTNDDDRLGIFELAEVTNTRATLRTTELYLSAIMDWAKKNRKAETILIVLEEAHTIIPEIYGSGFDADTQWVVSRIGQIALQGRKYGVGLLIVTQRTALVSKTILSQCNTYFTHALVDKTSLDYLASVYSSEHVKAIPNLQFLEFIAQGKAIKSDRPILAKREYDEEKKRASDALNATVNQ